MDPLAVFAYGGWTSPVPHWNGMERSCLQNCCVSDRRVFKCRQNVFRMCSEACSECVQRRVQNVFRMCSEACSECVQNVFRGAFTMVYHKNSLLLYQQHSTETKRRVNLGSEVVENLWQHFKRFLQLLTVADEHWVVMATAAATADNVNKHVTTAITLFTEIFNIISKI